MKQTIRIGLFGFGTVGTSVYQVIAKAKNAHAVISRICVRDIKKSRSIPLPEKILTDNGVKVAEIPQDVKNISPAMKKYEKLLLDRKLFHEDNPCARWNFGNVRLYTDANDNYKADKHKSIGRIDVIISAIISIAMHMAQPARASIFYAPKI